MNKRRKYAQDLTRFASYVATPHNLGVSDLIMPANGRLAISSTSASNFGDLQLLDTGRSLSQSAPALSANQIHRLDRYEKGTKINLDGIGTMSLYVLDEWNRASVIGTRAF